MRCPFRLTNQLLARPPLERKGLMSFHGPLLHGFHRGSTATFAEPLDVWLTALGQAVPFYKNVLIVVPSRMQNHQVKRLFQRAKVHFPSAHIAPLHRISRDESEEHRATDREKDSPLSLQGGRADGSLTAVPTQEGSRTPAVHTPRHPPPSALSMFSGGSLDLILFADNVFKEEMYYHAPWYISQAHKALRPHGVLAMVGQRPVVRVAAPQWASQDVADFLDHVESTARADLALLEKMARAGDHTHDDRLKTLRTILETEESASVGHGDIYFPFSAVQRRWFTSEFALSPMQLTEVLRGMPLYQYLQRHQSLQAHPQTDEDFVDIPFPSLGTEGSEDTVVGVVRQHSAIDPLEALYQCLETRIRRESNPGSTMDQDLRVQVEHFVVTCSNRSMNTPADGEGFRLPKLTRR
ncbi:hypothetical protein, conserved [Angomonas deanei]|uniref:Uncharacterized protein n=1 Tax=Angomonas deanei TaxID=59799 RepID=A0A7G2CAK5_9TRYP|nr:hypothetical protein, conserved [Angomonas deanei]